MGTVEKLKKGLDDHSDKFLQILNDNLKPRERERLVEVWNNSTDSKKKLYHKDSKKLIKDVGISNKSMMKIYKSIMKKK